MRWWDNGARVRVGLIALNATALSVVAEGWLRLGSAALAALLGVMIV